MKEIAKYSAQDMVRVASNDCKGCSSCCRDMGESIILDPYDIYNFLRYGNISFKQLLSEGSVLLNISEGIVLPHLAMQDTNACFFLTEDGRCRIHSFRPGLCRLFPLGRYYDETGLHYMLLEDACVVRNRTKIKIKKWLDVEKFEEYEEFLVKWHKLKKQVASMILKCEDNDTAKAWNMKLLNTFYVLPYDITKDFYSQFDERLLNIMDELSLSINEFN